MEKKKKVVIGVVIALVVIAAGIVAILLIEKNKDDSMEQNEMTVMYLTLGENDSYFIDTKNGTLFTLTYPEEEIYDKEGNKITAEKLVRGNILHVYGNGIMLESYPGQYPGVTRIRVVENGKPEDADQYNDLLAEIYSEPDPSEVPSLQIEYSMPKDMALVAVSITKGTYEWTYENEEGTAVTDTADSQHVMGWSDIVDLTAQDPTDLKLLFTEVPKQAEIVRWPEKMREEYKENLAELPEGTKVALQTEGDSYVIPTAEPGYIYLVKAVFEQGTVEYGFWVKEK